MGPSTQDTAKAQLLLPLRIARAKNAAWEQRAEHPTIQRHPQELLLSAPSPSACAPTAQAGMTPQVHGQVPPQSPLLRDQEKPLAQRLSCGNLPRGAVSSERSCAPQRLKGGGRADRAACGHRAAPLARPPNPTAPHDQRRSSKAMRTKAPTCSPARSAREWRTPFFPAPFPSARCRCRDPRTEPGGDRTSRDPAHTPAPTDALNEREGNVPFSNL